MPITGSDVLLEFRNVSKNFGAVRANDQVSFSVRKGSIHALVGENGAGKSTIMKILFGLYQADQGDIFFKGHKIQIQSPIEAKNLGIGMIHQHFMLAGALPALDHLIIEESFSSESIFKKIDRKKKLKSYNQLSHQFDMPVPWEKNIEDLSVGIQQRIEILKLLNNRAEVLILDEPTAVLAPQEVEKFFLQLKTLQATGKTILIVTHKLKEVFALADMVTVFRQGKAVVTKALSQSNPQEISELMLGRNLIEQKTTPSKKGDLLFELKDLNLGSQLKKVNLQIYKGEILGIAGVEGNGQSELMNILISPNAFQNALTGEMRWKNSSVKNFDSRKMRDLGLRFLPEDRLSQGCLLSSDLKDNFIFGQQRSKNFQKWNFLKDHEMTLECQSALKEFDVRPADPELNFADLSGGNQQKLVVARELSQNPELLIAAQPTRGVDIGAGQKIHHELLKIKSRGASVLLISSELDEVLKLSDRILVMFQGSIVGEISDWSSLPESQKNKIIPLIGKLMVGSASGNNEVPL